MNAQIIQANNHQLVELAGHLAEDRSSEAALAEIQAGATRAITQLSKPERLVYHLPLHWTHKIALWKSKKSSRDWLSLLFTTVFLTPIIGMVLFINLGLWALIPCFFLFLLDVAFGVVFYKVSESAKGPSLEMINSFAQRAFRERKNLTVFWGGRGMQYHSYQQLEKRFQKSQKEVATVVEEVVACLPAAANIQELIAGYAWEGLSSDR